MNNYPNVHILDHPLIRHKVAIIRDKDTSTKQFREVISEIATLMAFEAFKEVPTQKIMVETPLETVEQTVVKENSIAIVPILRAGLGMVDGILTLFPAAKVGHIGMYRNEETLEPQEYYCKLPVGIDEKVVMLVDPMLATGGSACDAITLLKKRGCKHIKFLAIIGAPEGIEKVHSEHPDVDIYVSTLDRCLNENGYILPGLGDAGDRIFGTSFLKLATARICFCSHLKKSTILAFQSYIYLLINYIACGSYICLVASVERNRRGRRPDVPIVLKRLHFQERKPLKITSKNF